MWFKAKSLRRAVGASRSRASPRVSLSLHLPWPSLQPNAAKVTWRWICDFWRSIHCGVCFSKNQQQVPRCFSLLRKFAILGYIVPQTLCGHGMDSLSHHWHWNSCCSSTIFWAFRPGNTLSDMRICGMHLHFAAYQGQLRAFSNQTIPS